MQQFGWAHRVSQGRWERSSPGLPGSRIPLSCSPFHPACQPRARVTGYFGPSEALWDPSRTDCHEARWRKAGVENRREAASAQTPRAQPAPGPLVHCANRCSCRHSWKPHHHRLCSQGAQPSETENAISIWRMTPKGDPPTGGDGWPSSGMECAQDSSEAAHLPLQVPPGPAGARSLAHSFPHKAGFPSATGLPFWKGQQEKNDEISVNLPKTLT